jgi:hypothetical protein
MIPLLSGGHAWPVSMALVIHYKYEWPAQFLDSLFLSMNIDYADSPTL